MHARLGAADPAAAAVILPSNGRRIVRALEVMEITGRPFAASLPDRQPVYDALQIGLDRTPDDLDDRVDERVHRMFAAGLVREVRELERRGLRSGLTASRALGYAQVLRMFDGELPETEVVDVTARATRRFVRRQRSWFRRGTTRSSGSTPPVTTCWPPRSPSADPRFRRPCGQTRLLVK